MYYDNKPCGVCGSEVRLRAHDASEPRSDPEPDPTVDKRVCTNPDCATNREPDAPEP